MSWVEDLWGREIGAAGGNWRAAWQRAAGQREEQQRAGEQPGDFTRLAGVDEAVVQHGDGGDAEERAMHGAGTAENARAAEDHGG